jgi:hypothetical protein
MNIQKYNDGKVGFNFGSADEVVMPIVSTFSGAGYEERGVRILMCADSTGVRFVEEKIEHVDNGYCQSDTWTEVSGS